MAKREKFIAGDHIADLNNIKRGLQWRDSAFTLKELQNILKGVGLPGNSTFIAAFKSSGIIKAVEYGKYKFISNQPIHVSMLERIYREYKKIMRGYDAKHRAKCHGHQETEAVTCKDTPESEQVSEQVVEETAPVENVPSEEQSAIALLRGLGYIVLKPVGMLYTEVLVIHNIIGLFVDSAMILYLQFLTLNIWDFKLCKVSLHYLFMRD